LAQASPARAGAFAASLRALRCPADHRIRTMQGPIGSFEQVASGGAQPQEAVSPHSEILWRASELRQQGRKVLYASVPRPHAARRQRRQPRECQALRSMPGISCPFVDGGVSAFPRIVLPAKAVNAAREKGEDPDVFYCLELLEQEGIAAIPRFFSARADGTSYFHTMIQPAEDTHDDFLERFTRFHLNFMQQYQDVGGAGADDDLACSSYLATVPVASKL